MSSERDTLLSAYARAVGLRRELKDSNQATSSIVGKDLNGIVHPLIPLLGKTLENFLIPNNAFWGEERGVGYCQTAVVASKVSQLISYLEKMHHVNSEIVEIGTLFNSMQDNELKERCSDLLSASDHFDRVINQATQILEDRIRKKSEINKALVGAPLVNAVINPDPTKSILIISENSEEHEGFFYICRGIVSMLRNPTHHHIHTKYSREDALKVCAFIDTLLHAIDGAKKRQD